MEDGRPARPPVHNSGHFSGVETPGYYQASLRDATARYAGNLYSAQPVLCKTGGQLTFSSPRRLRNLQTAYASTMLPTS